MPTYEYQCKTCGHQFEQTQRFSDPPLTECPKCSGAVRRMIFPAGVIFKGSGWYITDSRNNKLYVYRPNEQLRTIASFGGVIKNVQGITVDDEGSIFVSVQTDLKRNLGDIIEISKDTALVAQK